MIVSGLKRLLIATVVFVATPLAREHSIAAQGSRIVSGKVIDSAGRMVPGALVATLNVKGELVAQTVTGADGLFDMPLASDASVDVYALLTGYEPSAPVPVNAGSAVTMISLTTSRTRATISGQRSRQRAMCGAPRDTASDVTRLWQEARKALAATGLRYGKHEIAATISFFDRVTLRSGKTTSGEPRRQATVDARRPFRSLSADSAALVGYVIQSDDDVSYYAPDADMLLSAYFADSHCFAIAKDTDEHAGQIGLTFKPKNERPGISDIVGTLWFDRAQLELRHLEYRYSNAPPAFAAAGVGGDLMFAHLPNGAWLISRWEIRMPQGQIQSRVSLQHSQVRGQQQINIESLRVAGGEVKSVAIGATVMVLRD